MNAEIHIAKLLDYHLPAMAAYEDVDIESRIDRLEEIAETLEDGDVGLETAKELREEADDHLVALREALDVDEGELIEIDDAGSTAEDH